MGQIALAPGCAREYETIYILEPSVSKDVADALATRIADVIKVAGKLEAVELWGRRRLAYVIKRQRRGIYVYWKYLGKGETVSEIERQLRLSDPVIRYQTIMLRNNVPLDSVAVRPEDIDIAFKLPEEPEEPDMTRERELGLDQPLPDRSRRERERDPDEMGDDEDEDARGGAGGGAADDEAEV